MKRARPEGSCSHVNMGFSSLDYGNMILQHSSRLSPNASHACCACGQAVSHRCGVAAEADTAGRSLLRGCACGSGLLVDIVRSELYCCTCNDYVYHSTFDEGRQLAHVARRYLDRGLRPGLPHHDPGPDVRTKRARAAKDPVLAVQRAHAAAPALHASTTADHGGTECTPGFQVNKVAPFGWAAATCGVDVTPDGFPAGLRGLNNLGNTCFMNSVLQVFIHSPLMRNYFLGQGHSQSACLRHGKSPGVPCLSCELDAVFAAAYSGDRAPLSPTDFLYSWWTFADSLAGYRQQDAHEFYLSALSGLGAAVISEPVAPPHASTSPASGPRQPHAISGVGVQVEGGCGAGSSPPPVAKAGLSEPVGGSNGAAAERSPPGSGSRQPAVQSSAGRCGEPQAARGEGTTGGAEPSAAATGAAGAAEAEAVAEAGVQPNTGVGSCRGRGLVPLVDAVFGGVLRSDVTCSVCGHTSTAYDPFLDISLDMVAVAPGPPHLPYTPAGSRPLVSESTPASSPTLAPNLLAGAQGEEETEPDGASHRAAAVAVRPSASTCRGPSSLSTLSVPSPSRSLSGVTGTALAAEEQGEREGDEAQPGRSHQGPCASPSTGSGGVPTEGEEGGESEGQRHCERGFPTGAVHNLHLRSKGTSTASDDSCGPFPGSTVTGIAQDSGAAVRAHGGAPVVGTLGSHPAGAAATGAPGRYDNKPAAVLAVAAVGGSREAVEGLPRTTSDSMAAAESAADGGVGGPVEGAASPSNQPDDCITSPRVGFEKGANAQPLPVQQHSQQVLPGAGASQGGSVAGERATEQVSEPQTSAAAPAADYGLLAGDPGSRGATPGASVSCAEDTAAPGAQDPEEGAAEAPLATSQPSASCPEGQAPCSSWGGRRGGAAGVGTGRVGRGRGRGRRGGAGGRVMRGGAGAAKRGGSGAVPQMGQPGASSAQMTDPRSTRQPGASQAADAVHGPHSAQGAVGHATLQGCLRHFVTPERLSAGEAWVCSACKQQQPAVKQLSIRRLPPVLALHVKRFEHRHHHHHHHHHDHNHQHYQSQQPDSEAGQPHGGPPSQSAAVGGQAHGGSTAAAAAPSRPPPPPPGGRHSARKIQTKLHFPLSLDLAPYTTPAILRERYCMRNGQAPAADGCGGSTDAPPRPQPPDINWTDPVKSEPSSASAGIAAPAVDTGGGSHGSDSGSGPFGAVPSCRYRLFAVISHKGDLSGGHYVVFVRPGGAAGGSWYQCDDAWVTAVSVEDVTACQAYMLFYSDEAS